ncbi:MAG: nucleotidyltransferase family protein [Acidobacteria bacterium]|nr:nucleotidyltransferase family protein [Acidobacteriota bacterium]MBV9475443.1 nucleotidyltransferase family protein [Acidobacteriota bacterium]
MADLPEPTPIPACFRDAVRRLLRGIRTPAPAGCGELDAMLQSAEEHGIEPLLYRALDVAAWPAPVVARWRHAALRAAALEPFRLRDLQELLAAFDAAGIDALVLKGSALAYSLYPEPQLRPRGDTDLLIRRDDRARVDALLRERGFRARTTSGDELAMRQCTYTHVDGAGAEHAYDVHWDIANTPVFADALRFEELRARAIPLPQIAPYARGLSTVDALLYACIHRVAHHHDSDRIIWLVDIALLRERMSDDERTRFWQLAAERELVAVCRRSLAAAAEWLGDDPTSNDDGAAAVLTPAQLARDEPSARYLDRDVRRGSLLAAELRALPDWRARATRLAHLAFPPRTFMREQFGARTPLPLLYAWRALRGVGRLFARAATRRA